jgi:hypothetical protein
MYRAWSRSIFIEVLDIVHDYAYYIENDSFPATCPNNWCVIFRDDIWMVQISFWAMPGQAQTEAEVCSQAVRSHERRRGSK